MIRSPATTKWSFATKNFSKKKKALICGVFDIAFVSLFLFISLHRRTKTIDKEKSEHVHAEAENDDVNETVQSYNIFDEVECYAKPCVSNWNIPDMYIANLHGWS